MTTLPSPPRAGLLTLLLAAVVIGLDILLFPGADRLREHGGVETASALLYLPALLVTLARRDLDRMWMAPLLLGAMGLRELDFDKRFTSEGLLGIKVFTYDTAWWEKALSAVVLATLVIALVLLLRRRGGTVLRGLARRANWALYLAAGLALTVFSKSIDGLGRKLEPWGIDLAAAVSDRAGQIEEALELGIPILLLMSALAARRAAAPLTTR